MRQPDLEPSPIVLLVGIKLGNSQTCAVDRNGVSNVAVTQDLRTVRHGERAAAVIAVDGLDGAEVLDLCGAMNTTIVNVVSIVADNGKMGAQDL